MMNPFDTMEWGDAKEAGPLHNREAKRMSQYEIPANEWKPVSHLPGYEQRTNKDGHLETRRIIQIDRFTVGTNPYASLSEGIDASPCMLSDANGRYVLYKDYIEALARTEAEVRGLRDEAGRLKAEIERSRAAFMEWKND